jgi:hypothetical protein
VTALLLAALLPVALGHTLVLLLYPRRSSWLLTSALGVGVGYGVSSWLVFLCLLIIGRPTNAILFLEIALAGAAALLAYKRCGFSERTVAGPTLPQIRILSRSIWAAFIVVLAAAVATFIIWTLIAPYGSFDAWESWNKKAMFISLAGQNWRQLFTSVTDIVPDYPLFLPLAIAGILINAGRDSVVVPAVVALLFLLGGVGLIVSVLSQTRSRTQSLLAAMVLLGTPFFVHLSYAQYADIPLAYLFLATEALLFLHDSRNRPAGPDRPQNENCAGFQYSHGELLTLAGLTAGLSAWMKNEGLVFLLAVTASYFGYSLFTRGRRVTLRPLLRFAAGSAVPLLFTLYFKIRFAGTNAILQREGWRTIAHKLLTPWRYKIVFSGFYYHMAHFGVWPESILLLLAAYAVLVGLKKISGRAGPSLFSCTFVLVVMLAVYFLIFVASPFDTPPFDIPWYILVTLDRLLMQLWPTFLLLYFWCLRTPEEVLLVRNPAS